MAILNNPLYRDYHGHIDKLIVIKQYAAKTVMTAYPDMSKVVWSAAQAGERSRFAQAVAYAKSIIADPQRKAAYKARIDPGKKVFNAAIAEYMRKPPLTTERIVWIVDASGARPFERSPSSLGHTTLTGRTQERRGKGLVNTKVVPRSAKRLFERRITEPELNETLSSYTEFRHHRWKKSPV